MDEAETKTLAWVGDAVLALWARERILSDAGIPHDSRSDAFKALTSNRFLATMGQPTQMEADIGAIYQYEGLEAAFAKMDEELLPVFRRQLRNAKLAGKAKRHPWRPHT